MIHKAQNIAMFAEMKEPQVIGCTMYCELSL